MQNTFVDSKDLRGGAIVRGYDLNNGVDYDKIFEQYQHMGIQATNIGKGINIINKMINWELKDDDTVEKTEEDLEDPTKNRCKIFLGYTSGCITSGLRETIRYLVEHKMVNVICTPVTGIDEDLMKCFGSHKVTGFTENLSKNPKGSESQGNHKVGNITVPQENIAMYSEWLTEQIGEMHDDQIKNKIIYSPSKIIQYLGRKIDNTNSICYWAYKNSIPIFSPAFTDGLFGDVLYVYGKERPGFIVDLTQDIRGMNREPLTSKKTGCIVLGGGLIKHHILNANLMRNGTDFAVFVNTGQEFDGSDAGAKPQEALSWGKLRLDCDFVKISAEATMAFPFLVSQSFAKNKAKASKL